jgi:hypothetical protein
MSRYYIHLAGGLGDHLLAYFTGRQIRRGVDGGFGFLPQLKKEQPESKIKLVLHPVQQSAVDFFKHHPHISSRVKLPWRNPCHKCPNEAQESSNAIRLESYGVKRGWKRNPESIVYTTASEKHEIDNIAKQGPFIVVHPFAGQQNRMPIPLKQYRIIVNEIINEFSCNVVVIGATHDRTATKTQSIKENFKYSGPGIINLVNQASIRISTRLIQLSQATIANHSAMFCVAAGGDVPLVVTAHGKGLARFARQRIKVSFLDESKAIVMGTTNNANTQTNLRKITQCLKKVMSVS